VFGVPLLHSIQYARYSISYQDENAVVYRQAGAIPTLVAKTGYYLKQNALQTEGIFRLSGSAKRVAALQQVFDDPIRGYGANVDWEGNTVHDVATLMRRFLNQLPDPVITHKYYQAFRDVMSDKAQKSTEQQISAYQELIQKLPLAHQQLLLYLLDMLHLFAAHAAETKMDVCNLAAIFCPAILSHPAHNTPVQYKISQRVLEFLIEFQALFTMQV
ncbi:Rho GTPase activation protein, partial [Syncephalastrum racemosum]